MARTWRALPSMPPTQALSPFPPLSCFFLRVPTGAPRGHKPLAESRRVLVFDEPNGWVALEPPCLFTRLRQDLSVCLQLERELLANPASWAPLLLLLPSFKLLIRGAWSFPCVCVYHTYAHRDFSSWALWTPSNGRWPALWVSAPGEPGLGLSDMASSYLSSLGLVVTSSITTL